MESATWVQILTEAVIILCHHNVLGKGMNQYVLHPHQWWVNSCFLSNQTRRGNIWNSYWCFCFCFVLRHINHKGSFNAGEIYTEFTQLKNWPCVTSCLYKKCSRKKLLTWYIPKNNVRCIFSWWLPNSKLYNKCLSVLLKSEWHVLLSSSHD